MDSYRKKLENEIVKAKEAIDACEYGVKINTIVLKGCEEELKNAPVCNDEGNSVSDEAVGE